MNGSNEDMHDDDDLEDVFKGINTEISALLDHPNEGTSNEASVPNDIITRY